MKKALFDYYYGNEAEQFTFYRIPKILFTDKHFSVISLEAKLLYGIMLDRMALSVKNKWFDENNRVYIIYTVEDINNNFGCARQKTAKLLDELENGIGLIERKRQGLGKPNIIYVKNFIYNSKEAPQENQNSKSMNIKNQEVLKSNFQKYENQTSRSMIAEHQEVRKSNANNTNINNTEFNNTDTSFIHSGGKPKKGGFDTEKYLKERTEYRKIIADNIEFDILSQSYPAQQLNEIIEIITEAVCSTKPTIRVGQEEKPQSIVKSQLLKLDATHIECVIDCLNKNTTNIANLENYILTVLYKSYYTTDHRYKTWVQHDLYG